MKADSSILIGAVCSIFEISLDMAAYACELATDLVMSSSEQLYFYQKVSLGVTYEFVSQFGFFGIGIGPVGKE